MRVVPVLIPPLVEEFFFKLFPSARQIPWDLNLRRVKMRKLSEEEPGEVMDVALLKLDRQEEQVEEMLDKEKGIKKVAIEDMVALNN